MIITILVFKLLLHKNLNDYWVSQKKIIYMKLTHRYLGLGT
jgi:hypothetical protein